MNALVAFFDAALGLSARQAFVASLGGTFVLILIHWIASYFSQNSPVLSSLLKGSDTLLVKGGEVKGAALKREHISHDDLAQDLRQEGVEGPNEVKEARLERSGKVSVIKRDAR